MIIIITVDQRFSERPLDGVQALHGGQRHSSTGLSVCKLTQAPLDWRLTKRCGCVHPPLYLSIFINFFKAVFTDVVQADTISVNAALKNSVSYLRNCVNEALKGGVRVGWLKID